MTSTYYALNKERMRLRRNHHRDQLAMALRGLLDAFNVEFRAKPHEFGTDILVAASKAQDALAEFEKQLRKETAKC